MNKIRVAILVDGEFFLKRYRKLYKVPLKDPKKIADSFYTYVHNHAEDKYLYRIFYYDCYPLIKKAHNPISKKCIDFSKTPQAIFRKQFFEELKKKRKVALRIGDIKTRLNWILRPDITKDLLKKKITIKDLNENDVFLDIIQKGVDIRIGVDIAALAYKKFVDQIVLISGDSDFVPAAKVARREGIDFILDPMWNHINLSLFEHIDGLKSFCPNPNKTS